MPRGNQVIRQWRLLQLVSRPAGLTIADAARELDCSGRTVWRDLADLQTAGFPIYDDRSNGSREGVWRVEASFQSRLPLPIALDEVVALLLSERLLSPAGLSPLGSAIGSLIAKVRALLTPRALDLIDQMGARVGVRGLGAKLHGDAMEWLPAVQRALHDSRALRIRYFSMSRAAETDRRVDPYRLEWFNGGLYLIAYCHLRQAVRVFAVERIRRAETLDETFTVPADFDVAAYLASAWGMIRGERVRVRVRFSAAVAPYVRERLWHPTQAMRDARDGGLELTLDVADTVEVRRWLLGFGGDAEVVEPLALSDAILREAERIVARRRGPARGRIDSDRKPLAAAGTRGSRGAPVTSRPRSRAARRS